MPRPKELDFANAPATSKPGYQPWYIPASNAGFGGDFFKNCSTCDVSLRPGLINVRDNKKDDRYKKPQREAVIAKMLDSIEKDTAFRIDYVEKGTELQVMSTRPQPEIRDEADLSGPFELVVPISESGNFAKFTCRGDNTKLTCGAIEAPYKENGRWAMTKRWVQSIDLPKNTVASTISVTVEKQNKRFIISGQTQFESPALSSLDISINLK
ncbi:Oidioi.mRNA.OKI2018_I69.PAR.g8677.t1.cds [Oikopleura dioica]|uniref:Oidioi.mRNA.OKI2018_I69.PAR.g8677.t1.cds n=1 Tax=Oikopleura dioica TaxID=34765 RepID=A0ABN7RJN6_OIKDI|nr:Oidioi.mRNA.OKI2018_I69.PAR.g8677.t1.cds [Oikopleura dioica]